MSKNTKIFVSQLITCPAYKRNSSWTDNLLYSNVFGEVKEFVCRNFFIAANTLPRSERKLKSNFCRSLVVRKLVELLTQYNGFIFTAFVLLIC